MKKTLVSLALLAVAAVPLAGCGDDAKGGSGGDSAKTITLIAKGTDDHWTLVRKGAEAAGKDLGYKINFNAPDTENEGDKQINMLQSAINDHPAGIGIAPQDGAQNAAPKLLETAKEKGIPVVAFDTPVKGTDVPLTTIASDNQGMGAQLAENLAKQMGGEGKVGVVIQGLLGTAAQRRDGFTGWMKDNAPGVEIVSIQNGEADPAKSRDKAQGILQAHPDLKGLAGTSQYSTIAIADEVAAKKMDVKVVGIDAGPDILTLIDEDKISGIVTQNPYQIGYQTVEVLAKAASGEKPSKETITTQSVWVTKQNLSDPEIKTTLGIDG
ncbi:substrate-binding domain-containing protein [Luteococcus japonicus]|uniref:Possible fucose ABC transporter, substrate-binding component n=1 Tax=Luteococcus japonicus LSP_Lj1 TaxID=1255658 RepID=A0A1R4KDK1_9ACTN|nr:substrate-binding domain-containing protein [Luteococcus japonicus]SJN42265.1 Possible fucose ABC transporter, substrate-binding component [Luteococcus japonicus LSP_Lj1]